ncbi:hypothetical protein ACLB2K_034888 [Fragaria x ananassa]
MLQTEDIVEELRIGTSDTVKSPFKNGRSSVQKILHASFKAKDTSIQVRVQRGRDDFTELQACIVPNDSVGKKMNELDDRFPKQSKELLTFTAALDPQDDFRSFKKNDICSLVEKFYPQDFTSAELYALDLQLIFYAEDIHSRPELQNITSLLEL